MRFMQLRNKNGGFAQAQKREEREMFRCYYQAVPLAKMDGQRDNLEFVRVNLIEGDNDLTIEVFKNFLNVCYELEVPGLTRLLDIVKLDPTHPGKGNGYRIPSKDKDLVGHMKARAKRKQWRAQFRAQFNTDLSNEPATDTIARLKVIQGGVR